MRAILGLCFVMAWPTGALFAADISVLGGLTREASVQPGGKAEGRLLVRNSGSEPVDVRAYIRDYLFHADGTNVYGEPGTNPRSNSSWLAFTPRQFTVGPRGVVAVRYKASVPQDYGLAGTYWSILMIEPISSDAAEPAPGGEMQAGLRVVVRYGVQIVTHIGDTGERAIRFMDKQLLAEDAQRVLQLDIGNTGERWVNPLVWAELFDQDGISVGRIQAGRQRIYPGCSARFQIDLSHLPKGSYTGLIVADNGDEYVFGSEQQELDLR